MAGSMQHAMIYGSDGTGGSGIIFKSAGLCKPSPLLPTQLIEVDNEQEEMELGSLDDHVESFLQDDGDGRDLFGTLKRSPAEHSTESSKAKLVVYEQALEKLSAVIFHLTVLWNMDTLQTESTPGEHALIITDVCFRPNSTQLATSSFDRTVRLWNAAEVTTLPPFLL
ncbi:hypothetical protein IFM89_038617 [Coptis chinensis]|uniref:Uncharacterized protein n=1 Tax=Coptis chinensis TaxID=261450 RepID=A0A835M320_9MAGN|nr:hypothetical protein IFM89_038617 [Coptis chinensis]